MNLSVHLLPALLCLLCISTPLGEKSKMSILIISMWHAWANPIGKLWKSELLKTGLKMHGKWCGRWQKLRAYEGFWFRFSFYIIVRKNYNIWVVFLVDSKSFILTETRTSSCTVIYYVRCGLEFRSEVLLKHLTTTFVFCLVLNVSSKKIFKLSFHCNLFVVIMTFAFILEAKCSTFFFSSQHYSCKN